MFVGEGVTFWIDHKLIIMGETIFQINVKFPYLPLPSSVSMKITVVNSDTVHFSLLQPFSASQTVTRPEPGSVTHQSSLTCKAWDDGKT